jgi:hypothetical protein
MGGGGSRYRVGVRRNSLDIAGLTTDQGLPDR